MLEPDNTVNRPIYIPPPHHIDAGGLHDGNPHVPGHIVDHIERLGKAHKGNDFKWNYTGTGLCGGAYFRTSAILDAFSDAAVADLDWAALVGLWNKNVYSSDFAMPAVLGARGYSYSPWREIRQQSFDDPKYTDQPREAAFQHFSRGYEGGKPTYQLKLTDFQNTLFTTKSWSAPSLSVSLCLSLSLSVSPSLPNRKSCNVCISERTAHGHRAALRACAGVLTVPQC